MVHGDGQGLWPLRAVRELTSNSCWTAGLLHSFWHDAAIKAFSAVAQADPGCAMAHWGIAMAMLGNPFAWPPVPKALTDGWAVVERAKAAGAKTQRERDYIAAIYGAARAAELAGSPEKAKTYYARLVAVAESADTERPELKQAKAFIAKN